tara:strand:+ start:167 stop:2086 length:1920 start_codon:yes stop_codon:yes gene_type:complete
MKIFHILEARDSETRHLEHRRVYTTEEQYEKRGLKQVEKFNKTYNVVVTKYVCNESIEVLNLKPNQYNDLGESTKSEKQAYLLNDEELSEVEEVTREVPANKYDIGVNDKGEFNNPEDFNKYKEKIEKMEPRDSSKLRVSKDNQTATIDKDETSESIKKTEINLSESEIMSIIAESKRIIKKSDLRNQIITEANMEDSVRDGFESGNNDYRDILSREMTNQLAQESFRDIADSIRRKTGKTNVSLMDVQRLLMSSLVESAREEYRLGIENLERKAVDMIRKEFNIPVDAVEFDAKIVGLPPQMLIGSDASPEQIEQLSNQVGVKIGTINRQNLKMEKGNTPPPQDKTSDELKPKVKRRRLTNAMIHGAARKSQNLHHMDDVLRQENPQLGQHYSNVMAANDANYFLLDNQSIKSEGESGIHAGNVKLDLSNPQKPKIIAQGMVFPFLLHELSKGVLELMSLWGLPKNSEERKYVLDKTDNLESETNDIRLGAKIWEKFVQQIPVDNQEVLSLTWNMLQGLGDDEFNSTIEGLISGSGDAQNKVRRLADEALEELRQESSDEVLGGYDEEDDEEDGDTLTPPEDDTSDVDISDVMSSDDDDEETNYETMSKRELEREIDLALDSGDMDLVRQLGSILNKK